MSEHWLLAVAAMLLWDLGWLWLCLKILNKIAP